MSDQEPVTCHQDWNEGSKESKERCDEGDPLVFGGGFDFIVEEGIIDFFASDFEGGRELDFADLAFGDFDELAFFHFECDPVKYAVFMDVGDGAGALAEGYERHFLFETDFASSLGLLGV